MIDVTAEHKQRLSIITATYNAAGALPVLLADLRAQSTRDFEWIVVDGASSDNTLSLLRAASDLPMRFTSSPDFGIYDALNRGIRMARTDYYLVIGADDRLYPEAVAGFLAAIAHDPADVISADVRIGKRIRRAHCRRQGLAGVMAAVSSHSVGSLFRRSLHDRLGYYSHRLPIAADRLFLARILGSGARIVRADFVAGEFTLQGTTGTDIPGLLTESYRVELLSGTNRWLATVLLLARLGKWLLGGGR